MCPSGGKKSRGARRHGLPVGAPRPIALAGVKDFKVQERRRRGQREKADGSGQGLPDTEKGGRDRDPLSVSKVRISRKCQSRSHDTEALSAAGAVRFRNARMPRPATVWTVDIRMARSRLTDQFST